MRKVSAEVERPESYPQRIFCDKTYRSLQFLMPEVSTAAERINILFRAAHRLPHGWGPLQLRPRRRCPATARKASWMCWHPLGIRVAIRPWAFLSPLLLIAWSCVLFPH